MLKAWDKRIVEMEEDIKFMEWLKEYEPDYENEYSGDLLGLYDAFIAGRKMAIEELEKEK